MQVRAELTRGRVLLAAAETFSEAGYLSASMKEIVTAAGVTKGAAYFHFPSKEALAVALVEEQLSRWPPLVAEISKQSETPLVSVIALSMEVAARFRDDVQVRAGVALSTDRHLGRVLVQTPFESWTRVLTDLLTEAQRQALLRPSVVPAQAARALVGGFFGVQQVSEALTGRADLDDRLDEFWRIFLPGIAAEPNWPALKQSARRVLMSVHGQGSRVSRSV